MTTLTTFAFEGTSHKVSFVKTMQVAPGVSCDVYSFVDDESKDLGIIHIAAGCKTPLQKVLNGDKTIEGYISGKGKLTITHRNGTTTMYEFETWADRLVKVRVEIGETMQWEADKNSSLTAYEICYPPYEDGRYQNM